MHDLVIRGGRVVDGSGGPARAADVAVEGDRIAAVGRDVGRGRREVDAADLLVTPGWVDVHTHYDAQVTWDPALSPSGWHGVTTVVMGNCGVGFAPVDPARHDWLIGLMEGVEDIPGAALHEGIQWGWESFPEYLDALASRRTAVDFGTQLPHGALRAYVMGDRGAANEAATRADVARMAELAAEAVRAGALGFSTSRTLLHRTTEGVLMPGTFAATDELFGIGRALAAAGGAVFQMAVEHGKVLEELEWIVPLARETGQPVVFNLSQSDGAPDVWREAVTALDEAAAAGLPVYAQVAGRAIGIVMSWRTTANPFALHPTFQGLAPLPWEERLARLRDPAVRAAILAEPPVHVGDFEAFVTQTFGKMYPLGEDVDYEPPPEQSVAALAARQGRTPAEVAYDLLLERDGTGFLYFPLFNYSNQDLALLEELHRHPQTRMGLADGGAHCGAICDGGMPTFMLAFWTRDRRRGPTLPLEHVVMRQTSQTAALYGLRDRGLLRPGYRADLNLIDYDRLRAPVPEVRYDLPAGSGRLVQRAEGYRMTVCAGRVVRENGEATGELPGGLICGPQRLG